LCKTVQKRRAKDHWKSLGYNRCHYCCKPLLHTGQYATPNLATVERIIPGSQGGTYRLENTLVVCYRCNQKRGNKGFQNFISGSRFPRRAWLMKKYEEALKIYDPNTL
jgi:hypothetical protein